MSKAVNMLPPVVTVEIASRESCNQRCSFCFGPRGTMATKKQLLSIADRIAQAGVKRVIVSGGEPLTNKYLRVFLEALQDRQIRTALLTNGSALPANFRLLQYVDWIGLSLYGGSRKTDQLVCGNPGHFAAVTTSLQHLSETEILTRVETVVTPQTLSHLVGIGELFVRLGLRPTLWKVKQAVPSRQPLEDVSAFLLADTTFAAVKRLLPGHLKALYPDEYQDDSAIRMVFTSCYDVFNHHVGIQPDGEVVVYGMGVRQVGNIFATGFSVDWSLELNQRLQEKYDREWDIK